VARSVPYDRAMDARSHPGHQATLRHLREREKDDPLIRVQVAGTVVFDLFVRMLRDENGRVRIEDLVAALASLGGHLCLVAVLDGLSEEGLKPADVGVLEVEARDGHRYYFGDEPNRLLLESSTSLLSLVLGAAHHHGAPVSLEMVHEVMGRTAERVGADEFAKPDVPGEHQSALPPFEWVRHGRQKLGEALDLYEVPPRARPTAVGFALQRAIDEGREALDPFLAAKIAIECSVPMAKVDPRRFTEP
jgi:hypothetical protein